jgi:hypothetical protein
LCPYCVVLGFNWKPGANAKIVSYNASVVKVYLHKQ